MSGQEHCPTADSLDRALMEALAMVEVEPPAFEPPLNLRVSAELAEGLRTLQQAVAVYQSALRIAFNAL